jgi:hypothetical protein
MKRAKMIVGLSLLIILTAISSRLNQVSAQEHDQCKPIASQIYFVDSGQSVIELHPGCNGGNGYQLNIIGIGVDNLRSSRNAL